jgi:cadmium resistance protein CadD (predicted permease)
MEKVMNLGLVGQAIALFAMTNIDDIIVLAVFLGQATSGSGCPRVVLGQYVGFAGILLAAVVGTLGAGLLRERPSPTCVCGRCS